LQRIADGGREPQQLGPGVEHRGEGRGERSERIADEVEKSHPSPFPGRRPGCSGGCTSGAGGSDHGDGPGASPGGDGPRPRGGTKGRGCYVAFWMARSFGLDVGTKTVGVAVSDGLGLTAQPVTTLRRTSLRADLTELRRLAEQHDVEH